MNLSSPEGASPADDRAESVPELQPWDGPPENMLGAVLSIGHLVQGLHNAAVALTHATAFPTGVMFHIKLLIRRGQRDDEAWQEAEELLFGAPRLHLRDTMPDALRRYAIVYQDGTRTTTLDDLHNLSGEGPTLTMFGGSGSSSETLFELNESLWLWPLPPAESLELSIEWPLAGIELTQIELDGASFAAAATEAQPLWPEPNVDQ